jgi:hypothetical protein
LFGYRTECEQPVEEGTSAYEHCTIALAREAGTPALEVAREVGTRLGWPVYERELPLAIARELRLPPAIVEEIDEKPQSWILECLESFVSKPELSESRYVHHLIGLVRSLGKQGHCVIVGHGAAYILPPASTLRVSLIGANEDRIAALGRRLHMDLRMTAHKVAEINRQHRRFIRDHFCADPAQPRNYDLVLNTEQWSPADCADFIVQALEHKAMAHLNG